MADDDCYELNEGEAPSGIVEIPVEWIRDDAVYFGMDRFKGLRPYTAPEDVFNIFKLEFDRAYEEGGLFQLTMHPFVIGYRSRIWILEKLISYIKGKGDCWIGRHDEVAHWVNSNSA
jgi:peptidoglycan/xylan/chitin deacetylase (PgdA/CDA1 family)